MIANLRARLGDESATAMPELVIAIAVLATAVMGVLGSMGLGMSMVGGARQRSAASAVAAERLERVRNIPYERVALYEQPTHNTDETHPDYKVTINNQSYAVDGSTTESLIVDTTDGALKHVDDPWKLGKTEFSVYQYVTWVDDAGIAGTQDYKRVTVVVTWKYPVESGVYRTVTQSSFVNDGTIHPVASTPMPTSTATPAPQSTPTPTPTPTGTPNPNCAGDVAGPTITMEILNGAGADQGYTNSTTLQVRFTATDNCTPLTAKLSNDNTNWTNVATLTSGTPSTVTWTIASGDGEKHAFGRVTDGNGNVSSTIDGVVILDQHAPAIPQGLSVVSCSMHGADRDVTLTWQGSSDTNLSGYRLYRSVESAPYELRASTASTSASDTSKKSSGSVRYVVRAYDKAGNESGDSNVVSFSKNSC